MKKTLFYLVVSFFFVACPVTLLAQNTDSKEQLAAYYYSNGDFEQAAELYEGLYERTANKYYYQMLRTSLIELKRYKEALKLTEKHQKKHSGDLYLYVDLGRVYELLEEPKKANKCYNEAVDKVKGASAEMEVLASTFQKAGLYDFAAKTYITAREKSHNAFLYYGELANVYQTQGNYEAMMQEYFDVLDNVYGSIQVVQVELQKALHETTNPALEEGLRRTLVQRVQQSPNNPQYLEMMIWFSLQIKDFEFAMVQAKAVDARFPEQGAEQLYRVANIALSNEDYDVARQCYAAIVAKGKEAPHYLDSRMGELNVQFAKLNRNFPLDQDELADLRGQYEGVLQELGKTTSTVKIMRDYAVLLAYYANDVQAASDILYDILEMPKVQLKTKCEVKLDLGDLMLFAGEIWDASLLYMQAEKSYRDDVIGAQAKYKNAKLSYYNNDFEWAKARLDVLRASTTKLIANDAMQLSLLISDNMEDDSTYGFLETYAAADLFLYRNLLDSAWVLLEDIEHRTLSHPILDEVLMQKAKIRLKQSNYIEADTLLSQLIANYGEDILADDALLLRAQLNEDKLKRLDVARDCYEKLLIDYPASLYVEQARKAYNRLNKKLK